jgi:6-phosphogluconolactonase
VPFASREKGALCALALLTLAVLTVGTTMPAAQAATFVYVSNAETNDIDVLRLDPAGGDLTPVERVTIPKVKAAGPTTPMAVTPDKRHLHVAVRSEPYWVSSFTIDPATGKLKFVESELLLESMAYISVDRAGKFLFSASYPGHKLTVNPINPENYIWPAQQVAAGLPNAHAVLADPSNRYVLATSLGSDRIVVFPYDAARGELALNDMKSTSVKEKAGPRHFVFHPNGRLVYLLCELDGTVYAFDYDPQKGALTQKQVIATMPADYQGKIWAADLHITPDGKFLYASERTTSTLIGFKVGDDGALTALERAETEQQPRAFAIDPSGRYLLAVGQLSHMLSVHAVDAVSGKLTRLKRYPMGKNPNWVEIVEVP